MDVLHHCEHADAEHPEENRTIFEADTASSIYDV